MSISKFELRDKMGHGEVKATITINAPMTTGAEQNLVVLDDVGQAVAVIELQPGIDRREVVPG